MVINGKKYDQFELNHMAKLYEKHKAAHKRGAGGVGTVPKKWPSAKYIITYGDGSQVTEFLNPGDPIPQYFDKRVVIIRDLKR